MNQRKEKQSARFIVTGENSDRLYLAARAIGDKFFPSDDYDLYFEDAEPLAYVSGNGEPVSWKCYVTAAARKRVES